MALPLIAKTACCAIASAIVIGSLWPRLGIPGPEGSDLFAHAAAYAMLTIVARLGWPQVPVIAIGAVAAGLGIGLETAQAFVPGRAVSAADAMANAAGVVFAVAALRLVGPALRR